MPRYQNPEFRKLNFKLVTVADEVTGKPKYHAFCNVCLQLLKNTAAERLKTHRTICTKERNTQRQNSNGSITTTRRPRACNARIRQRTGLESDSDSDNVDTPAEIDNLLQTASPMSISGHSAAPELPDLNHADFREQSNADGNIIFEIAENVNVDDITSIEIINDESVLGTNDASLVKEPTRNYEIFNRSSSSSNVSISTDNNGSLTPSTSCPSISSANCSYSSVSELENVSTSASKRKRRYTSNPKNPINKFVDTMSAEEAEEICAALADMFFGCNIAFAVIESKHVERFVRKIRPAFVPYLPSRKILASRLLSESYERCVKKVNEEFYNSYSCLLIDGWKNESKNSKTVVTMIHNAKNERAFLKSYDYTLERETAANLVINIEDSIKLAKEKYQTDVYAVITDNASNMVAMGNSLSKTVWHNTCMSHTGNLLAKDVIDTALTKQVTKIINEFHNSELAELLVQKGGTKLVKSCDTRWCSYRDSYQSYIKNQSILLEIATRTQTNHRVSQEVKSLLVDDSFTALVTENIKLLDPICELINVCQSDNTCLAEGAKKWLNLQLPETFNHLSDCFEQRKHSALTKYAISAYYLHPANHEDLVLAYQVSKTENSDEKSKEIKSRFIILQNFLVSNLNQKGINDFFDYVEKKSFFRTIFSKKLTDGSVFWKLCEPHHSELSKLAQKLLLIPASTAALERLFSNWSYVHNDLRNRLTQEHSEKLVHVYHSLKLLDINSDEY